MNEPQRVFSPHTKIFPCYEIQNTFSKTLALSSPPSLPVFPQINLKPTSHVSQTSHSPLPCPFRFFSESNLYLQTPSVIEIVTGAMVPTSIPAGIRKTIQSIKEIVGNHSDADIYVALKEASMDPNETAQKLLLQDPFHEVKRKRIRNKENVGNKGPAEHNKNQQEVADVSTDEQNNQKNDNYRMAERSQRGSYNQRGGHNQRGGSVRRGGAIKRDDACQREETVPKHGENHLIDDIQANMEDKKDSGVQNYEANQRDGGVQRGDGSFRDLRFQRGRSFLRGGLYRGSGISRGGFARIFLPVKTKEFRVVRDNRVNQNTTQEPSALQENSKSNRAEVTSNVSKGDSSESSYNQKTAGVKGPSAQKVNDLKGSDEKRVTYQSINTQRQAGKSRDSRPRSAEQASNNSVLGVYSSSSDPVHVPSPARSYVNGSFRREVGVVGVRKMPNVNVCKQPSADASLAKSSPTAESVHPHISPKGNQNGQNTGAEPVIPLMKANRPFSSGNQYAHRSHQQPAGHQKAVQKIKEWKPKSSQKSPANAGIESAVPTAEFASDGAVDPNIKNGSSSDKHSSQENHGVIIADHIRVPDIVRCRVTFGSFGLDKNVTDSIARLQTIEANTSLPVSVSDASNVKLGSHESTESSASGAVVEHQYSDTKDSSSPQNIQNYTVVGMVGSDITSYTSELQKQHDETDTVGCSTSGYDPQTGYTVAYFKHSDESRDDGIQYVQENMNAAGMVPASQALYQQQAQVGVAQMYPQVHVSHYMPYRQLIPPVYVPPMGMPGYSANPAYAHPVNGNGYVLMPGASHLNGNVMKYGAQQQFKPSPGGSPTGFGNYTAPNGYTVNAPGGMMGTNGVDDSSRIKYKDGNLYVQNPPTEALEMWMQNSREMSGLQSSQYYQMQGQSPHGAYMPSHPGHHAMFNPVIAQSSHMQYPNLYHPQAAAISNPHHMPPANVGLPQAAPMAQVGSYQQPQVNSHLQWTSNTF